MARGHVWQNASLHAREAWISSLTHLSRLGGPNWDRACLGRVCKSMLELRARVHVMGRNLWHADVSCCAGRARRCTTVDILPSIQMPSSCPEKRAEQQRTRRARGRPVPMKLGGAVQWHPCIAVAEPVPQGLLVVVGQAKRKRDDAVAVTLGVEPATQQPSFPWRASACPTHRRQRVRASECDRLFPVATATRCLHALARKPFSEARREAFEDAYLKAKPILDDIERARAAQQIIEDRSNEPHWAGTSNDPWSSDRSYPRFDGPYHVMLRPEPRPGHVWVSEPEDIEIEYVDGGPPKLREWQIRESDVDASHLELPWRILRRVLEASGAHEAERLGDFACRRPGRSGLPEACPHCWHIHSRCVPRCHPPNPTAGARAEWERLGYCSEHCAKPAWWDPASQSYSRCRQCDELWAHRERGRTDLQLWTQLHGGVDACKCCSSTPTNAIRVAEWAYDVCCKDWHHARMHRSDDLWYLGERFLDAANALRIARGADEAPRRELPDSPEPPPCDWCEYMRVCHSCGRDNTKRCHVLL